MTQTTSGPTGVRWGTQTFDDGQPSDVSTVPRPPASKGRGFLKLVGIQVVEQSQVKRSPLRQSPDKQKESRQQGVVTKQAATIGIRGYANKFVLRRLYRLFGFSWLILAPSLREQIALAEQDVRLLAQQVHSIEFDANQKGGSSKSTGAATTATVRGDVTRQIITVIDGNQAMGSSRSRLGVPIDETVTVRTATKIMGSRFDHMTLIKHVGHHPRLTNVRCIASDDFASRAENADLTLNEAGQLIYRTWRAGHSVIVDLGNNLEMPLTQAALNLAHVARINFVPWQENSEEDALDTLRTFRHSHEELMSRAVIVVNGYNGPFRHIDKVREKYAEYFDNHPVEQIVVIPFDKVFGRPNLAKGNDAVQPVRVIDPQNFARRTYLATLKRDRLVLEMARLSPKNPYRGETMITETRLCDELGSNTGNDNPRKEMQ